MQTQSCGRSQHRRGSLVGMLSMSARRQLTSESPSHDAREEQDEEVTWVRKPAANAQDAGEESVTGSTATPAAGAATQLGTEKGSPMMQGVHKVARAIEAMQAAQAAAQEATSPTPEVDCAPSNQLAVGGSTGVESSTRPEISKNENSGIGGHEDDMGSSSVQEGATAECGAKSMQGAPTGTQGATVEYCYLINYLLDGYSYRVAFRSSLASETVDTVGVQVC